ncbi:MAG: hypothetical protein JWM57_3822 [Phycisphaerales bacterium]|nr:hypothetical protein [Phycisphaerales bacterium]
MVQRIALEPQWRLYSTHEIMAAFRPMASRPVPWWPDIGLRVLKVDDRLIAAFAIRNCLNEGVLIGVWPMVMAMLIGAGFGRRSSDPAYDLDAFSAESPAGLPAVADVAALALDDSTDEVAVDDAPQAESAAPLVAQPVTTLSTPPLPSAPATPTDPPKEYAGRFYPTQVHAPAAKRPGN